MTRMEDDMEKTDPAQAEPLMEDVENDEAQPMEGMSAITEVAMPPDASTADTKPQTDPMSGEFLWLVENFSKLPLRHYSPVFTIAGYPWNILMFARGNKVDSLSVYLNVPDVDMLPPSWSRQATFKLTLVNQLDGSKSHTKETSHSFVHSAQDWGFSALIPRADLEDPANGFLVNDTLKIHIQLKVEKYESTLYDSKKETGYVGLKNQGATCYMNSLLQTLYNINFFRQAVYHMPTTQDDDPQKSIPLALQSLFYKLQFGDTSVSTKDLTKSFGWDTYDAFMQHDVQELNRVLCEKLEDKMKGTPVAPTITNLFEGHTCNFIECIHVDYKSTRRESFMDLQLDVKGCKDVYESFDKYCESERLEGQNQYKAEDHGLQDAKKGVLFEDFPPVLQLQLKRFEYDFSRDVMVKVRLAQVSDDIVVLQINDRYEFPEQLDLDVGSGKYLAPSADRSVRNLYKLHSVCVHSGGVHGGHYYCYIRPDGSKWLKFDDEKVTVEEPKKAMDEQFGGDDDTLPPAPGFTAPTFKYTKYSNAYMLVYIREDAWANVMREVGTGDIAEHVRVRLEREREDKERRRAEKADAHLYTLVRVATDADLTAQIGTMRFFDLVDHDKVRSFRVKKQMVFRDFAASVAAPALGVPPEQQRWWTWAKRQNGTYRPAQPMLEKDLSLRVMDIKENTASYTKPANATFLNLFLETDFPADAWAGPLNALPPVSRQFFLLFLKLYDPVARTLKYVGHCLGPKASRVEDLAPLMRKLAGLPEGAPLQVFEEIKFEPLLMCEQMRGDATLHNAQLEDGDILCYQRQLSPEEAATLPYPTVRHFMDYVRNRLHITFKRLDSPKEDGVTLELRRLMGYDEVSAALAKELQLDDPRCLRFTQPNTFSATPKNTPIRWRGYESLDLMLGAYMTPPADTLFYEVLDIPLPELERLKILNVSFHGERGEAVSTHTLRVPKEATVADVLAELVKQLGAAAPPRPLRLMEIYTSKIYKVYTPETRIDIVNDQYWTMRAEAISADEAALAEGDAVVHVVHFRVEANATGHVSYFGDPVLMRIGANETLAELKPRIQARLGVAEEDFAKWRFAVVGPRSPEYLADSDCVAAKVGRVGAGHLLERDAPAIGLDHADTAPRRHHSHPRLNHCERPVRIYN